MTRTFFQNKLQTCCLLSSGPNGGIHCGLAALGKSSVQQTCRGWRAVWPLDGTAV